MLFVLWSFCVFLRLFRIIILGWIDNAGGGGLPSYAPTPAFDSLPPPQPSNY